jgi:hypothetical protein
MSHAAVGACGGLRANSVSAALVNTSAATGTRSASVTLGSDGTCTRSPGTAPSNWFSPTQAGIGSLFWAKASVTSSVNTTVGGTIGTGAWTSLSGGGNFTATNSGTSVEGTGNYTISIANDSAGSNVVGSVSGSWDVGFVP